MGDLSSLMVSDGEVFHNECFHEYPSVHQTSVLMVFRGREEP